MDAMVITRSKMRRLEKEEARRQKLLPPPDLISNLPDDVLGGVITLLPSADGARTQLLSRRWRPLWRSAPLNFEAETFAAAEAILTNHGDGPCRRLSFTWHESFETFPNAADEVLRLPGLDGLQEFELFYKTTESYAMEYESMDGSRNPAPLSVSRFSQTLRVLSLCFDDSSLEFPEYTAAAALGFPHLEQLTLKGVIIPESTFHGILSSCQALRSLVLHCNTGYKQLRISSRTLRSLGVSCAHEFDGEIVVEDAPLLERLYQDCRVTVEECSISIDRHKSRVIQAPKLKIVGYLRDIISEFGPEKWSIQKRGLVSMPNAMRTVKILALDVSPEDLDDVIILLTWFPCVEKLYMALGYSAFQKVQDESNDDVKPAFVSFECLDEHLKILQLKGYRGIMSEVSLVRFFLSNARVLESLNFLVPRNIYYKKWLSIQRRKLRSPSHRASQGARLCFMPDPGHHHPCSCVPIKHIHDLILDDPFVTSSCTCPNDDSTVDYY